MTRAESKAAYNARERRAYGAFVSAQRAIRNDPTWRLKGGQKGFRALVKERGWKIPPAHGVVERRYAHGPPSARQLADEAAERKFLSEGLGRPERAYGDYYRAHYN